MPASASRCTPLAPSAEASDRGPALAGARGVVDDSVDVGPASGVLVRGAAASSGAVVSTSMKAPVILVMARTPVAGQVKTRLIPALGPEGAARLHARLLHRTLQTVTAVSGVSTQLWWTGEQPPLLESGLDLELQRQRGSEWRAPPTDFVRSYRCSDVCWCKEVWLP